MMPNIGVTGAGADHEMLPTNDTGISHYHHAFSVALGYSINAPIANYGMSRKYSLEKTFANSVGLDDVDGPSTFGQKVIAVIEPGSTRVRKAAPRHLVPHAVWDLGPGVTADY
jgi:hypothetical protein